MPGSRGRGRRHAGSVGHDVHSTAEPGRRSPGGRYASRSDRRAPGGDRAGRPRRSAPRHARSSRSRACWAEGSASPLPGRRRGCVHDTAANAACTVAPGAPLTSIENATSAVDGTEADRVPVIAGVPSGNPGSGGTGSVGAGGEVSLVVGSGASGGDRGRPPRVPSRCPRGGRPVRLRRTAPTTERSSGGRSDSATDDSRGCLSGRPSRSRPAVIADGRLGLLRRRSQRRQDDRRGGDRSRHDHARRHETGDSRPRPDAAVCRANSAPGGRGICPGGFADRSPRSRTSEHSGRHVRDGIRHRHRRPLRLLGGPTAALHRREVGRQRGDAERQRKQNQRQPVGDLVRVAHEHRAPRTASDVGVYPGVGSGGPGHGARIGRGARSSTGSPTPASTLFRCARIQDSRRPSRARE